MRVSSSSGSFSTPRNCARAKVTQALIIAALPATGDVNFAAMALRLRNSGVRLMKPKKCEAARPAMMRKAPQMAATPARMTKTAKPAMSTRGVQMAATPARKTETAKLAMSTREVQAAATVPRLAVISKGLLMAATPARTAEVVATPARTTEVAKPVKSAKEVQTTAGMMKGNIV